jgi:ABC-type Fe3+/spermidine/putrescine transport system ATPase subunit
LGISTIFVTHDQDEALTISDRIAVLSQGKLEQFATPEEIYRQPASAFVAGFVGESNRFAGVIAGSGGTVEIGGSPIRIAAAAAHPAGTRVEVLVRPEFTVLRRADEAGIPGTVVSQQFQGARVRFLVHPKHLPDPTSVIISDVSGNRHDELVSGSEVSIAIEGGTGMCA